MSAGVGRASTTAWWLVGTVLLVLACPAPPAAALSAGPGPNQSSGRVPGALVTEYQFKMTWIAKFTNFVSWPENCRAAPDGPFRIGIVGRPRGTGDPFPSELWGIEQELDGRRLEVVRVADLALDADLRLQQLRSLRDCHVVFVCWSERRFVDELLPQLAGSCALTVSDVAGFAEDGGMLTLTLPRPRHQRGWRLAANLDAARAAGLSIRPDVLKLRGSRIVSGAVPEPASPSPSEHAADEEREP